MGFMKPERRKMTSLLLAIVLVFCSVFTTIADNGKRSPKAAVLPEGFVDVSKGLTPGTNYGGISVLEEMPVKDAECVETTFDQNGTGLVLDTFVQGTNNPTFDGAGIVPESGAAFVVEPFHSGTFTIAFKLYGNGKTFRFVDDKGTIIKEYTNQTTSAQYLCMSFDVMPGTTYYAYAVGSKIPTAGLSLVYDDFLNVSKGLKEGVEYGEFSVTEDMKASTAAAVEFTAVESGNKYTFTTCVTGTQNVVLEGLAPIAGAGYIIKPVKSGTFVVAFKLGNNKQFKFTDDTTVYTDYKNTSGSAQYICHEYDVEAGKTYYLYGLGTKVNMYGLGLKYDKEVDLSKGLVQDKDYGGISVWDDMPVKITGEAVTFTDEMTGEVYSYDTFIQGSVNPTVVGSLPESGAVVKVSPVADGTFRIAFRLGKNKQFYFVHKETGKVVKEIKNTTTTDRNLCYTFDVEAGNTYYAYGVGTKIPVAAMEMTYTAAIQKVKQEVVLPDPVSGVAQKAYKTYNFDSVDEVKNMNSTGNNSTIVNRAGIGHVLKLGAKNTQIRKASGVEIANPFVGRTDMIQTLAEALERNGVVFNGTKEHANEKKQMYNFPENLTYPFPKYTNGLTFASWVKIPEKVTEDTVIYAMTHENDIKRGIGAIRLTAGGSVWFFEGTKALGENVSEDNFQRNSYRFQHDVNLVERAGQWVHIAMTIENDNIGLYVDGLRVDGKPIPGAAYGQYSVTLFNKGFGYRGAHAAASVSNRGEAFKNYRDLLINFSDEEFEKGDFSDYSKYTFLNSSRMLLVDFAITEDTYFWLGGDDGDALFKSEAGFTESAEGMMFDDLMFFDYPLTEGELYGLFLDEGAMNDGGSETIVGEGEKEEQEVIKDDLPNTLISSIDFDKKDVTTGAVNGLVNINSDINNATLEFVTGHGMVLKTGLLAEGVTTANAVGVELKNPFAGKTQYKEELADALERNGVMFNGTTENLDAEGRLYYQEGLTYPFPKWKNGFTISVWARMPKKATQDTPLLTFSRRNPIDGQGSLTIMAGGSVRYYNSDRSYNDMRNAYYFDYEGENLLKNAGKWVQVTLTIENDNISVYFNGVKAKGTAHKNMDLMETSVKFFNYGFGYRGAMEEFAKINPMDAYANYRDLVSAFTAEEKAANNWSDYSKYTFLNCGRELLLDFLTDYETKMYVGGDFGTVMTTVGGDNQYANTSAGLRVDSLNFYNYLLSEEAIMEGYTSTKIDNEVILDGEEVDPPVTPTPPVVPTPPVTPTPPATPTSPVTPTPTPNPPAPEYKPGDADKNGKVDLADAQKVLRVALKIDTIDEIGLLSADVDGDQFITLTDAQKILRAALKIEALES